jgi:hypothetical protein
MAFVQNVGTKNHNLTESLPLRCFKKLHILEIAGVAHVYII